MLRVHYPESEPTTHPHKRPQQQPPAGDTRVHVHNRTTVHHVTAAIAAGKHPAPSRTRKLSQPAPMVLHPRGCGRVGRRRTTTHPMGAITRWPPSLVWGAFCVPVPSRFLRSERAWQTVVSRAAGGPRAGDPRAGGRLLASRVAVAPTSLAPIGPALKVVAVVRTPPEAGRAVDRPAGPLARVTGHGLLRSRVRARPTRSGTTVRRSPRRSPAASSTARSADS